MCYYLVFGMFDGLFFGFGEGGVGLGLKCVLSIGENFVICCVFCNVLVFWNLGYKDIDVVMYDGWISVDDIYGNGFDIFVEEWLFMGLEIILVV